MRKYFNEMLTIEALRNQFRAFCIELHPDKGGNHEDFIAMKAEYDDVLRKAAAIEAGRACAEGRQADFSYAQDMSLAAALEKFLNIAGINIEICGKWLWISGNTFPVFEQIQAAGGLWSKTKKKWYYSPYMTGKKKLRRKPWQMDKIRDKFGSQVINSREKAQPQLSMSF